MFGLAVPVWIIAGAAAGGFLFLAGGILMLITRDRRLERVASDLWLVEQWSLFALTRRKKRNVQPGHVALTVPESGLRAQRRTILTVQGEGGPVMLEQWRHPADRIYASVVAEGLARWFDVRLSGALAAFDGRPESPGCWAALRASQENVVPAGDAERSRQWTGRRPAWDVLARAWIAAVGAGLMLVSTWTGHLHGIHDVLLGTTLPMGALIATYGLAGVLSWRIVTELRPDGLHVERVGLRSDLFLHLPFAAVTWVGAPNPEPREAALRIGSGDAFVDVTPRKLGLTPAAFGDFCTAYQRGLAAWLNAKLRERPAPRVLPVPSPPAGPVTLDDRRAARIRLSPCWRKRCRASQ